MRRRILQKSIKRLSSLPGGNALIKYCLNKLIQSCLRAIKSTRVAWPSTIMLELSAHCNLHCVFCPRNHSYGHDMEKGFMDKNKAKAIIDQLWPYLDSIGLSGMGETFLNDDLEEIVDHIRSKNKGIIISVSTNAIAPGVVEITRRLKNKIDTIQVSADGVNEVYNNLRGGSDFARFRENLIRMAAEVKESSTDLMINMVVSRDNHHQMSEILEFAGKTGIRYLNFTPVNLAAVTDVDISYYDFFSSRQYQESCINLKQKQKLFPRTEITFWNSNSGKGFKSCPFPWTHFYICWNGFIPPCCAKPFPKEYHFGNIFEQQLTTILNNSDFRQLRKLWFKDQTPEFCSRCHFIKLKNNLPAH